MAFSSLTHSGSSSRTISVPSSTFSRVREKTYFFFERQIWANSTISGGAAGS